jgi:hypothetical protein
MEGSGEFGCIPPSTTPAGERQDWGGSLWLSTLFCQTARAATPGTPEGAEGEKRGHAVDTKRGGAAPKNRPGGVPAAQSDQYHAPPTTQPACS